MRIIVPIAVIALTVACSRTDQKSTEEPASEVTITAASADPRPSDQDLIRRAEAALGTDPELSIQARNVAIDAVDGYLSIGGSVDNQLTKAAIEKRLDQLNGVRTTLNKLDVRDATPGEVDDTISYNIERALVSDPALAHEADKVTIDVDRGVVTLRGEVSSLYARQSIERAIEKKPGVVTVNDRLTVANP